MTLQVQGHPMLLILAPIKSVSLVFLLIDILSTNRQN